MGLSLLYDWPATLSLVFGGCCSNAITLEQLTSRYPNAGSLITLFQFVLISLHGLPKHVTWTPYGPRFRPRRIPITPYLVQVGLFYLVSLLNNAAFGYDIPMSVHIIFRSGGLIVSMVLGWLISGKRYNLTQVISVLLVTLGVALTTLSATPSTSSSPSNTKAQTSDTWNYTLGIFILSLALILSGFLGLVQDWTYTTYGRGQAAPSKSSPDSKPVFKSLQWQESMFYLHFLALPMFIFLRQDLEAQFHTMNSSSRTSYSIDFSLPAIFSKIIPSSSNFRLPTNSSTPLFILTSPSPSSPPRRLRVPDHSLHIHLPYAYAPLLLNTLTQLLCAAGVNRLTTRVSALTVTLILVVRKAVSLVLSVLGAGIIPGVGDGKARTVDQMMMWSGAALVLVGTVLYSVGTGAGRKEGKDKKKKE